MGWRRAFEGAVVALLLLPAAVHGRQQDPAAELLAAAADGRWQDAIALLDAGAPATARTADDWTVLHYAARDGWLNLLDRVLAAGAAPAAATAEGYTPLELAAFNGRAMVVAIVLDVLPDTAGVTRARERVREARSRMESEPPADAAEAERRRRQLESTARVLDHAGYARDLRLTRAAATGDIDRIRRLLNEGASPSAVDPWDYPALVLAAGGNHNDVAIALLRAGADPDVASPDGWTALHFAARDGRSELLAALMQAGAEPTPREPGEGRTPLWLAAFNGNVTAALVLLAAQEWSTTATAEAADGAAARLAATGDGAPSAALRGRLEQMQTMLAGLDVASGAQPTQVAGVLLTRAVDMALDEAVAAMLAAGIDAGAIGPADGRTPLHAAAARGDTLVVTFLQAGATPDPVAADGHTPLMLAAEAGHLPTVLMLYMHGADPRRADAGGLTAGGRAAAAGQDAAARLLAVLAPADTAPPVGDLPDLAGTRPDSVMPPAEALEHAVLRGDDELVGVLLDMGLPAQERVRTVRDVGEGTTLLMLAADSGRVAAAGALMDAGADVYARDHAGRTALRRAALAGQPEAVRLLARRTVDLDARDAEGLTDLEWAARSGLEEMAALLLEAGASAVANADGARWLPIHTAARDGRDLLLDALIAAGSPLDPADEEGRTPLMLAAYNGNNYGVAALMLALGPGTDAVRDAARRAMEFARPLALQLTDSLAALGPDADDGGVATYLADIESVLDLLGDSRRAAAALLMMQAYRGRVESVEALLSDRTLGLDAETGYWGRTPLINAALGGQAGTAAVLLQAGARPDPVDSRGWTPLHYAARDSWHELLDLLLDHGADPEGGARDERSPLMLAAYNGNLYGVSALLRRLPEPAPAIAAARDFAAARRDELEQELAGADGGAERDRLEGVRVRVDDALRLLAAPHHATGALLGSAAWLGRLDVVARLLAEGVDPDAETLLNRSALVLAAEQGHADVAIALLQAGADPTAAGHNGWSALHVAARDGLDGFIDEVVRQPVTPDLATPEGFTPLYLAVHNRRDATVAALLTAGADADEVVDGESIRRRVATDWGAPEAVRAALERRAPRWAQPDTLTTAFLQAMRLRLPFQDDEEPGRNLGLSVLRRVADASRADADGVTLLHAAAAAAEPEVVAALLERGAPVDAADAAGVRPLHLAVAAGDAASTRLLLRAGADPDVRLATGETPLLQAVAGGTRVRRRAVRSLTLTESWEAAVYLPPSTGPFMDIALLLVEAGADPTIPGDDGRDAVRRAREAGHGQLADALARRDRAVVLEWAAVAEPRLAGELLDDGVVPSAHALASAAARGDTILMRRLIDAGAPVNSAAGPGPGAATAGWTALHEAATRTDTAVVRILLAARSDPNRRTADGSTPIHLALDRGESDAVDRTVLMLMNAGASPTATDSLGRTPIFRVAGSSRLDLARQLVAAGADVRTAASPEHGGRTPLMEAARRAWDGMPELILGAGARVNERDAGGRTPLHHARGDARAVAVLLDAGADIDAADRAGRTALSHAVTAYDDGGALLLLERGADPLKPDTAGRSPLWYAAADGEADMVAALVDAGADPFATDRHGVRPVDNAAGRELDTWTRILWCSQPVPTRMEQIGEAPAGLASDPAFTSMLSDAACTRRAAMELARGTALTRQASRARYRDGPATAADLAAAADSVLAGSLPADDPRRVEAARILAEELVAAGRFDEAATALRDVVDRLPAGHAAVPRLMAMRADVAAENGTLGLAAASYQVAVEAARAAALADGSLSVMEQWAWVLAGQALLNARLGDVAAATRLRDEAVIRLGNRIAEAPYTRILEAEGARVMASSDPSGAHRVYRALVERRAAGTDGFRHRVDLARSLAAAGEPEAARRTASRVLDEGRALVGPDHPLLADALFLLGTLAADDGDGDVAIALLLRAAATAAPARAPAMTLRAAAEQSRVPRLAGAADRADLIRADPATLDEEQLAQLQLAREFYVTELEAAVAVRTMTLSAGADLAALPTASQQAYVARVFPQVRDAVLTMQIPDALERSYHWLSRWKGLMAHMLSRYTPAAAGGDGDGDDVRARLQDVRVRLAAWARMAGQVPASQWEQRYQQLTQEKEQLESDLVFAAMLEDPLAERTVAEVLQPGEVLIDMYRYAAGGGRADYGAVLVREGGRTGAVRLGSAAQIDEAVEEWRRSVARGEAGQAAWARLDSLLWQPVASALGADVTRVWISPDGVLSKVPWHLLATGPAGSDSQGGVRERTAQNGMASRTAPAVSVVPAPRQIVRLRTEEAAAAATGPGAHQAFLVGAVDFDAGTLDAEAGSAFDALPGTATELDGLVELARRSRVAARAVRGADADKDRVVAGMQAATWVHIATHGFFEGGRGDFRGSRSRIVGAAAPGATQGSRNPLLESGLALAGANVSPGRDRGAGVLTAEEMVGLDLSAARLVVLSACETALGSEVDGQGVMGLQTALLASGARTLLMSLWKVPDESTALLMTTFYEGLWVQRLAPGDALTAAQERVRRDPRFAAPVHWAAWVLAGETW